MLNSKSIKGVNILDFLDKLDFMMNKLGINKRKLSNLSGVPYTTIDTFYKKGYENTKLSTIKKIAEALDVSMDYLVVDSITDEDYGKTNGFYVSVEEQAHIKKYRALDKHGKEMVDIVLAKEAERIEAEQQAGAAVPDSSKDTQTPTIVPEITAELAKLARQNQELAAEIAAMKEEDAAMEAASELSVWSSALDGSLSQAERRKK